MYCTYNICILLYGHSKGGAARYLWSYVHAGLRSTTSRTSLVVFEVVFLLGFLVVREVSGGVAGVLLCGVAAQVVLLGIDSRRELGAEFSFATSIFLSGIGYSAILPRAGTTTMRTFTDSTCIASSSPIHFWFLA